MVSFFNRHNISSLVIFTVLSSFILTHSTPLYAVSQFGMGINQVAFIYRLEKLVEKIWKLEKSENKDKMYEVIIDLKSEIEASCGVKIDLHKHMDTISRGLHGRNSALYRCLFVMFCGAVFSTALQSNASK